MKKTAIALAMATVLGVAGTAMAANPFTDVPANHWSYASVAKLAQAGIVEGYGDGTFQGNNTMTRYEMAQIVAKAMARSDKADAAQKAMIEKLAAEYSTELNNLGVRVSALEKKTDNVKITGEIRVARQTFSDKNDAGDLHNDKNTNTLRTRLTFTGAINDDWKYVGRYQDEQNFLNGDNEGVTVKTAGTNTANNGRMNLAYVQGPIAGTTATIGRQGFFTGYGLVFDSYMDGINLNFGNLVKTNVMYGKINNGNGNLMNKNNTDTTASNTTYGQKYDIYGINFAYATSKVVNLKAGYYSINANGAEISTGVKADNRKFYELGFDWKMAQDWTLIGAYAKSDHKAPAGNQDSTWKARVNYKAANLVAPHSYGLYAEYRNQKAYGTWDPTGNYDYVNAQDVSKGFKGYMIGGEYVFAKNIKWQSEYYDGKSTVDSTKSKSFWNAVFFYF